MSIEATAWAVNQRGLPPVQKLILLYMADCHDPGTGGFASVEYLSRTAELPPEEIVEHVCALVTRGVVRMDEAVTSGLLRFDLPIDD